MLCDWCCCGSSFVPNIWPIILCSFCVCQGWLQWPSEWVQCFWRDLQWTAGVVALWAVWYYYERNNGAESLGTAASFCSRLLSVPRMSFRKMTKKVKQLTLYIRFTRRWNDWQGKTKENLDCLISHVKISERKFYVWENWVMKQYSHTNCFWISQIITKRPHVTHWNFFKVD